MVSLCKHQCKLAAKEYHQKKATAMVSVPDPLVFLTDPRIRNPELWMPINYGSGSGIYLDIFVAI
jgi:hypothetical protein